MVPTLQRFFNLLNEGISVQDWYLALPRATPASTMHPQQTQLKISAVHQNNDFEWIKRADHPAFRRGPLPSSYFTEKQRAMHRDYAAPNPDAQKSNATAHSAAQSTTHPATNLMLSSSSPSSDSSSAATGKQFKKRIFGVRQESCSVQTCYRELPLQLMFGGWVIPPLRRFMREFTLLPVACFVPLYRASNRLFLP